MTECTGHNGEELKGRKKRGSGEKGGEKFSTLHLAPSFERACP